MSMRTITVEVKVHQIPGYPAATRITLQVLEDSSLRSHNVMGVDNGSTDFSSTVPPQRAV